MATSPAPRPDNRERRPVAGGRPPADAARRASRPLGPRRRLDPALASLFRPFLPALTRRMVDEIQRVVSAYGPGAGNLYLANTRLTIGLAVEYFVDHLNDPNAPRAELDETLRRVGRGEAYEGRSLESLITALRIGVRVADEQLSAALVELGRSKIEIREIVAEIGTFIDSMAAQAAAGYREAQEQLSDAAHQWRGRVLELVLAGDDAPPGELARHAALGNWTLPETVVLVAVQPSAAAPMPSPRMLRPGVLANLHSARPVVLLPGTVTPAVRAELAALFGDHRIAIGAPVPLQDAESSLRWARRALDLSAAGVLPDDQVIDCTEHIGALWIHSEPLLVDIVDRTLLAPLYAEPPNSRRILGETLLAWIETRGASAPALAALLGKHPQTVRYRLKRLRTMFGSLLDQPERVTEIHYALRAGATRWNGGRPAPHLSAIVPDDID